MSEFQLHVIGVDQSNPSFLDPGLLKRCGLVASTPRFVKLLRDAGILDSAKESVDITPLDSAIAAINQGLLTGDVAVMASGDPLFFGIGRKLIETFGKQRVTLHPAVSSVQHAFARFGIPWDDSAFISLHGRPFEGSLARLLTSRKLAVLTDHHNRPEIVAQRMLDFTGDNSDRFMLHVAENLGGVNERCVSGTLEDIANQNFDHLCCLLIIRQSVTDALLPGRLGLTEKMIVHSRGLITKNEVRAAVLHALAIPRQAILWDIGAGSGSVGLEAARMHEDLLVYAVEREEEQHQNIRHNIKNLDVANLRLIIGEAPAALAGLPRPDRIFIGGSGGNLQDIINIATSSLKSDGRIVISAVLPQTALDAPRLLLSVGLEVMTSKVTVERRAYPDGEVVSFNPITIICGHKKQGSA